MNSHFLTIFLNRFRPLFFPLELRVIGETESALQSRAREIFTRQINTINFVQRWEREVVCYSLKKGKPWHDPALRFANNANELKLATVEFGFVAYAGLGCADLYLAGGDFVSIVFDSDPVRVRKRTDIVVKGVRILQDPMLKPPEIRHKPGANIQFSGWLREWERNYRVRNKRAPLEDDDRKRLIDQVPAALPAEYIELTEQCDGFEIDNSKVKGLSQVYLVHLKDADFLLLGEWERTGAFGVKANADSQMYYLDFGGDAPVRLGKSFRRAVEALMAAEKPRH